MPAPTSTVGFIDLLRKSSLVEEAALDRALEPLDPDAPPECMADALVRAGVLTPFQTAHLLEGKWKGFAIGKYRVLELLGTGGMGHVYLCEHRVMRRLVALKVLPLKHCDAPGAVQRFHREARAAAALDHPHLVRAYDVDQDGRLHFLVLEFVDGRDLHDVVTRTGPLDVGRACEYARQAAHGLQHAHDAGVVHRDVKPGNLLLDRSGTVKILDMGLARLFGDVHDNLTRVTDGGVLGTADFLAPEQAAGREPLDGRADVYALGGTLSFLLTGRPPYGEGSVAEKLIWHQVKPVPSVREFRPEVPEGLAAVVARMTAKDPAERPPTAAAVAAALEPWARTPPRPSVREIPERCPAVRNLLKTRATSGAPTRLLLRGLTPPGAPLDQTPMPATLDKPAAAEPAAAALPAAPPPPAGVGEPWNLWPGAERRRWLTRNGAVAAAVALLGVFGLTVLASGGLVFIEAGPLAARRAARATGSYCPVPTAPAGVVVSAADAPDYEGREVTVEFTVRGTETARGQMFLNSEADPGDPAMFSAVLTDEVAAEFRGKTLEHLKARYEGRKVRVTGTVELSHGKAQVVLTGPRQIRIVRD